MFDQLNPYSGTAVAELYDVGDNIVGVYNREVLEAEEACIHLSKVINAHANNLDIPVNPKAPLPAEVESVASTNIEEDSESVTAALAGGEKDKQNLPSLANDAQ